MTDLSTTIDRATQISRCVANTLARRLRAAMERYSGRMQRAGSVMLSHFRLDQCQRALSSGLKVLLPLPAGAVAVASEKPPARKSPPRTRKMESRGAARA